MNITHIHHIIPKHMGGTDDPLNLIELTIDEHSNAHKKLWEEYHKKEDYIAWKFLSGQANDPLAWKYKSSLGGKFNKGKLFWYNPITNEVKKSKLCPGNEWIKGRGINFDRTQIKKYSCDATNSIWCHNPNNIIESKMIKDIKELPDGWILGRSNAHITEENKTKGYKFWYNMDTGEITSNIEKPGDNWTIGIDENRKKKLTNNIIKYCSNRKGSKWYFNPLNINETKMIKDNELIPNGWKLGRPKNRI